MPHLRLACVTGGLGSPRPYGREHHPHPSYPSIPPPHHPMMYQHDSSQYCYDQTGLQLTYNGADRGRAAPHLQAGKFEAKLGALYLFYICQHHLPSQIFRTRFPFKLKSPQPEHVLEISHDHITLRTHWHIKQGPVSNNTHNTSTCYRLIAVLNHWGQMQPNSSQLPQPTHPTTPCSH